MHVKIDLYDAVVGLLNRMRSLGLTSHVCINTAAVSVVL